MTTQTIDYYQTIIKRLSEKAQTTKSPKSRQFIESLAQQGRDWFDESPETRYSTPWSQKPGGQWDYIAIILNDPSIVPPADDNSNSADKFFIRLRNSDWLEILNFLETLSEVMPDNIKNIISSYTADEQFPKHSGDSLDDPDDIFI